MEKGEIAQNEHFISFLSVFYAICTLKSLNSHINVVVCSFFEFWTVSKWCIRKWVDWICWSLTYFWHRFDNKWISTSSSGLLMILKKLRVYYANLLMLPAYLHLDWRHLSFEKVFLVYGSFDCEPLPSAPPPPVRIYELFHGMRFV